MSFKDHNQQFKTFAIVFIVVTTLILIHLFSINIELIAFVMIVLNNILQIVKTILQIRYLTSLY